MKKDKAQQRNRGGKPMECPGHPRNERRQVLLAQRDIIAIDKVKPKGQTMSRWLFDAVRQRLLLERPGFKVTYRSLLRSAAD